MNPGGFSCWWLGHVGKDQPGPDGDLECADLVGVGGVSALGALGLLLGGAVVSGHVPAGVAGVGGVAGVHRDHYTTGAFSVREEAQERTPTRIVDVRVQSGLRGSAVRQEPSALSGSGSAFGSRTMFATRSCLCAVTS